MKCKCKYEMKEIFSSINEETVFYCVNNCGRVAIVDNVNCVIWHEHYYANKMDKIKIIK